jgi:hypothetical protein
MGWDREKWNRFVADNEVQIPTDDAAKNASAEAKSLAETHEENIDLDAIGVQRVRDMLENLATETIGDQGATGPGGIPIGNAIVMVGSNRQFATDGAAFNIVSHVFEPNELRSASDLILVSCYQIGLDNIEVFWTPVGEVEATIFEYHDVAVPPDNGKIDIWIAGARSPLSVGADSDVESLAVGVTKEDYAANGISVAADWMDGGGTIRVSFVPTGTDMAGGQASVYRFNFARTRIDS